MVPLVMRPGRMLLFSWACSHCHRRARPIRTFVELSAFGQTSLYLVLPRELECTACRWRLCHVSSAEGAPPLHWVERCCAVCTSHLVLGGAHIFPVRPSMVGP